MNALKIALIRQRYTPFGGAERFVSRAMNALQQEGTQVQILTRSWQGTGEPPANTLICNPPYWGNVWRDASFSYAVHKALRKNNFDLVQSHERISGCDIFRAGDGVHREWLRLRGLALPWWQRLGLKLNPYHYYTQAAEARLFNDPRLRAVICNSSMVAKEISLYFPAAATKTVVIYSGIDSEKFHPRVRAHRANMRAQLGIPADAQVFLSVGSGFARKGVEWLLRALASLPTHTQAVIVGTDKQLTHYQRLAQQLGLSGRVHWAGGQRDVLPWYGLADVFVLPTLYDPFPNVTLEAFACGLPVITSEKCGAAEFIRPQENGAVHAILSVQSLQTAMADSLHWGMEQQRAARETVAHLTPEHMARTLLDLYHHLLAETE